MDPEQRSRFLTSLTDAEILALKHDWPFWARAEQLPPGGDWTTWLVLAGRGFGKTRTGAEWVRSLVEGETPSARGLVSRLALVAEDAGDARDVMVEGESGILACAPPGFRPHFEPTKRRLTWPNGAMATLFSADDPDSLRGPQFEAAWCDELAKWRYAQQTWDNLQFGLRLGARPRQCVTTTPRALKLLKEIIADPGTVVTRGSTRANVANLAPAFLKKILAKYEGTRLGRQELEAEIIEDTPGALWSRAMIDKARFSPGAEPPDFQRMVVAVDPPVTSGEDADECGIIVAALGADGHGYVLADLTSQGESPSGWGTRAARAYHAHGADRIVIEVNQGGEMVEQVLRQCDPSLAISQVRASRGKVTRAEPVSALYEQGRVHHVGQFTALEDQMCALTSDFDRATMGYSPDRVDALVWAITELMLSHRGGEPRIRML